MINFKEETLEILKSNNKTIEDIEYIACDEYFIDINDFFNKINFEYDDGYGGANIWGCLYIVGKDWWLERGEYDGSEWWEFKTKPQKPEMKATEKIFTLIVENWKS